MKRNNHLAVLLMCAMLLSACGDIANLSNKNGHLPDLGGFSTVGVMNDKVINFYPNAKIICLENKASSPNGVAFDCDELSKAPPAFRALIPQSRNI